MGNKILKWIYGAFLIKGSTLRLSIASTLGLLVGLLPLFGIRFPIIIALSLICRLNVIALTTGMLITTLFPIIYLVFSGCIHLINSKGIMLYTGSLGLEKGDGSMLTSQLLMLGSVCILLFPFLKWLSKGIKQILPYKSTPSKMAVSALLGIAFCTVKPPSMVWMLIPVLIILLLRLNIPSLIIGFFFGTACLFPLINTVAMVFGEHILAFRIPVFVSSYLSVQSFQEWLSGPTGSNRMNAAFTLIVTVTSFPAFWNFYKRYRNKHTGHQDKFVFYDPHGYRWKYIKSHSQLLFVIPVLTIIVLFASFTLYSFLPDSGTSAALQTNPPGTAVNPDVKRISIIFDGTMESDSIHEVLNTLQSHKAKATFFVTGKNALKNPATLRRILEEGHTIGIQSFTGKDMADVSDLRFKFELNAAQMVVQVLTGHSTKLLYLPRTPDGSQELQVSEKAGKLGFIPVSPVSINHVPNINTLFDDVMDLTSRQNTIAFNNADGYRDILAGALPDILDYYGSRGYKFPAISDSMGKSTLDVMPAVSAEDSIFVAYGIVLFKIYGFLSQFSYGIFLFGMYLILVRFGFVMFLGIKHKKRLDKINKNSSFQPFVSIVIAAYNEEKVICKTIDSLLQSRYNHFEIIVVNDGSTDNTSKVVKETYSNHSRVRVVDKENGGKASAVNLGFKCAYGEIVILLDADTLIDSHAVSLMVRHFEDTMVAAVSGAVKVGNVHNLLTLWQHIEYVSGFSLERRALNEMGILTVVPGAIGAWRKDAVASIGYYQEDTLTEDADITIAFLQKGYKIVYEGEAIAYTEAPADMKSLIKQRVRWTFGMMQCLWKRKNILLNPKHKRLGYIALPYIIISQFLFYYTIPLGDALFIHAVLGNHAGVVILLYFSLLLTDFITALFAFVLWKENPKILLWLPLQRLIYRYIMLYVVFKSTYYALKGVRVGWNKLKRMGNVVSAP